MSDKLTRLPRTQYSGLDFSNIIQDIRQLVTENPDYNENWDDFLESNAGRMITELFAYIADNLATRIDWNVNENFIGTATQRESVIKILRLIGYNFKLPIGSEVKVNASFDRPVGSFFLSPTYDADEGTLTPFSITARDKNGEVRKYELIRYDDTNEIYDYKTGYEIDTGNSTVPTLDHELTFFEGETIVQTVTASTDNNPIFALNQSPVIEGSVRVFKIEQSNGNIIETELPSVRSFLDPVAQQETDSFGNNNPIAFVQTVNAQNTLTIEFAPTALIPNQARRAATGDRFRIFYRIGGGVAGNITVKSINTTKRMTVNNSTVNISFVNNVQGVGGRDGETAESAAVNAPLLVRTAENTVTEDDYDIILSDNSTVIKSKSYGNNNIPSNLYNLYGLYIRPLEVWNYILKNKPGWEDIPPSRYGDFQWISLRLENRFNQKHAFRDGTFNTLTSVSDSDIQTSENVNWDGSSAIEFKNFVPIVTSDSFKNDILIENNPNQNFKAKITDEEVGTYYYSDVAENNIFDEKISTNNGEFNGSIPQWRIEKWINARYLSDVDISGDVDLSVNNLINLGFDNRTQIENIDLSSGAGNTSAVTPQEIRDNINATFQNNADYNNGTSGTVKGYQEFGLSVNAGNSISFSANSPLYWRVNTDEYTFTPDSAKTFTELASEIKEAMSIKINGDTVSGQNTITNVDRGDLIYRIREGMQISASSLQSNSFVGSVDILEGEITVVDSGGSDYNASNTTSGEELTVYPFDVTIEGSSPTQDIRITNLQENPVGPVWIEDGTSSTSDENLLSNSAFSSAGFSSLDAVSAADGVSGYQELGIDGVISATSGFQNFSATSAPAISTGNYEFKLDVDGAQINSGNDIVVSLANGDSLTTIASKIDTELTNLTAGATCAVVESQVRITSNTSGSSSTITIDPAADGNSMITLLGGTETAVAGEDAGDTGLSTSTSYTFKINKYEYEITTGGTSPITFNDLDTLIVNAISPHSYSTATIGNSWEEDIRITSDTTGWVDIEDGETGNPLFENLGQIVRLDANNQKVSQNWSGFDAAVGGGDYSIVAYVITETTSTETNQYILVRSPGRGEHTSIVRFTSPSSNSALNSIFGFDVEVLSYGYRRATIITNPALANAVGDIRQGNILFENGSARFDQGFYDFYVNHLSTDDSTIFIGRYNNEAYDEDDPAWREVATRIYSTHYDSDTQLVDPVLSEFDIRFTKKETSEMSLFNINSDWNLTESSPSEVTSVSNPESNVDGSNYLINIDIDGRGFVEIDVTGDTGGSAGSYSISQLIDNINSAIQGDSAYSNELPYSNFTYATENDAGDKIIIKSPTNTNSSKIEFNPPSSNDATNEVFGLSESGSYSHLFEPSGDYYLEYDLTKITGDFAANSTWVTDITANDLDKVEVGMKVIGITNVIPETNVLEIDEGNNRIRLETEAISTQNDQDFQVSRDLMKMTKLNTSTSSSNIPDLEMNFHFIFDKRYVEGAFDGATRNGIKTSGYPLGSLDEDIYKDSLSSKKISAIENVFKETRFTTFDVSGTVFYDKIYSKENIEQRVENSLQEAFKLENREYGSQVAKSQLLDTIHSNSGVRYVRLDYFGPDATDNSTNIESEMQAKFDEIIVLSENQSLAGTPIHGLILNYEISGSS